MHQLLYWLDIFGTAVFAFSGALMAGRYKLDPFGVMVLATVTAIGGGTIRDLVIGASPVFWVVKPVYLWVILATSIFTIVFIRRPRRIPHRFLLVSDALGLGLFAVLGCAKSLTYGVPTGVAIMMGAITGVAGGMIRDVLCNEIPLVLQKEIYATAAILGAGSYVLFRAFNIADNVALIAAISAALMLRLAAIYWQVTLPAFQIRDKSVD